MAQYTNIIPRLSSEPAPALLVQAREYARAAKAENTRDAYRSDWGAFVAWCAQQNATALPATPSTVALYITHRANLGRKVATIERALAAISQAHKAAGHTSPRGSAEVRSVLQGIRRTHGIAPDQKRPVTIADLDRMVATLPDNATGARDGAVLLLGFASAMRRSELAALNVEDVDFTTEGLVVQVRRSKRDQEGAGRRIGIPHGTNPHLCPVQAVARWLAISGRTTGPLFVAINRGGRQGNRLEARGIARIVKRLAQATGLDPAQFAGHSLRSGFATAAAKAGKSEREIMRQTGHRSTAVLRRYIRDATLFTDNAAQGIGL